jgi:hypothetical protein
MGWLQVLKVEVACSMHHLVLEAMVGTWCELIISKAHPPTRVFLIFGESSSIGHINEKTLKKNGLFTRKPTHKQIAPNNSLKPYRFH